MKWRGLLDNIVDRVIGEKEACGTRMSTMVIMLPVCGEVAYIIPAGVYAVIQEPAVIQELTVKLSLEAGARVVYKKASKKKSCEKYTQEVFYNRAIALEVLVHVGAQFEQKFSYSMSGLSKDRGTREKTFEKTDEKACTEKRTQVFILAGQYARVIVSGALKLTGMNRVEYVIKQIHNAPDTISNVNIKTVLDDRAFFSYHGMIHIAKEGARSVAHQENKNITISAQARALSVPNLEALTNDISCGHGSAVASIDDLQLFYLASRGIKHAQAKKLIIRGFLKQ